MGNRTSLLGFGCVALAIVPAQTVVAAEYLTIDEAQKAVFPEADAFAQIVLALSPEQRQAIAARAGAQPGHGRLQVFAAKRGKETIGHLFIDEVIGRQDLITYALGIAADGSLRAPEILSYRESHGGEVRGRGWRQQFANRRGLDDLVFQRDIKNIAGSTLSSEHLTQGICWLVATWEATLRPGDGRSSGG